MKQGDREAFSTIYKKYVNVLYAYASKFLKNRDQVKDSIQELFIEIWNRREFLADVERIKPYLLLSIRRKVTSYLAEHPSPLPVMEPDSNQLSAEDRLVQNEIALQWMRRLQKQIAQLPDRELEAIQLRYYEALSYAEIAAIMEINEQSVRNVVARAIRHLREAFISTP